MRDDLFNAIIGILQTVSKFIGEDGTVRVYDWPTTSPGGYPYVVVGSESLESSVLDSARDSRRYNYNVQVVGEKFGEQGGMTQSQALAAMRATEDAVVAAFDAKFFLNRPDLVIRSMPTRATYGLTDGGARVILTMSLAVDTAATITIS